MMRRLPKNPHREWLQSTATATAYILLVVGYYANVAVADEKVQLLPSIGSSRHRLSIHRKKSERHRHAIPPEVVHFHSPVSQDEVVDGPTVRRRHLARGQKKKNKRHNRIIVRTNNKEESSRMKRGDTKQRIRNHIDKKKKKEQEDDEAEKDKRKKEKTNKTKEGVVKRKKKNNVQNKHDKKKKKSDGKDGLLHKNNGDISSWDDW
eukprot:scaffold15869_cov90-Skeletonema_dohrnii-CCMP3373.AAC.2